MFPGKPGNRVQPAGPTYISDGGGGAGVLPDKPSKVVTSRAQRLSKKVNSFKKFFARSPDEHGLDQLRDREQTMCEIWVTFIFTLIMGAFFVGGGLYLIWLGSRKNVVDFIVVGAMGVAVGACSSVVGLFLFCKPLCQAHRKRKRKKSQQKDEARIESEYITRAKARLMSLQIADSLTTRRPSNAELYGEDEDAKPADVGDGPRTRSASSKASTVYDPPPPLAVPTKPRTRMVATPEDERDSPVEYKGLDKAQLRPSTREDKEVIANAADARNVLQNFLATESNEVNGDKSNELSKEEVHIQPRVSDFDAQEEKSENDTQEDHLTVGHQQSSTGQFGSSADLLTDLPDPAPEVVKDDSENQHDPSGLSSTNAAAASPFKDYLSPSVTVEVELTDDEEGGERGEVSRKRRALSAVNDRMSVSETKPMDDAERNEEDDVVVVTH